MTKAQKTYILAALAAITAAVTTLTVWVNSQPTVDVVVPVAGSVAPAPVDAGVPAPVHNHGGIIAKEPLPVGAPGSANYEIYAGSTLPKPADDGVGAFRSVCQFTHALYDDPIVYPGMPGKAHLHMFFGNAKANASSTYESLRATGNGSCRGGTANRSAYWVPAALGADGTALKPYEMHVYYKSGYNGIATNQVKQFPRGMRLISGDMSAMKPQSQGVTSWKCWENYNGQFASPNEFTCPANDWKAFEVFFPQCWNGKDLDSPNHKDHVVRTVNGKCPTTHPVAIPELSYHILYSMSDVNKAGYLRLSSDMYGPTQAAKNGGWSGHGDWMEAWDPVIAEVFVPKCIAGGKDCQSHLVGDGRSMLK